MTDQAQTETAKQAIERTCAELQLTMTSQFIPFSQSRHKGEKSPSLNWIVTLHRNGKPVLSTDYGADYAHAPSYNKNPPRNWDYSNRDWKPRVTAWECESGYEASYSFAGFSRAKLQGVAHQLQPDIASVIHSLVLDSDVLDSGGFENWASNYGYDTDSRKAESIYKACLEIALQLRAALGDDGMAKLRTACQDY